MPMRRFSGGRRKSGRVTETPLTRISPSAIGSKPAMQRRGRLAAAGRAEQAGDAARLDGS
jgi:hypothetical protein